MVRTKIKLLNDGLPFHLMHSMVQSMCERSKYVEMHKVFAFKIDMTHQRSTQKQCILKFAKTYDASETFPKEHLF